MKWLDCRDACSRHQADLRTKPRSEKGLPLEATETIEFTTDEVTWMSVDISPDGTTLVFDLLGDLYTMPAAGGEATRIVGGISFESQPRFSPSGDAIAFLSDRSGVENLWLIDTGRQPIRAPCRRTRRRMARPSSWRHRRGRPTATTSSSRRRDRTGQHVRCLHVPPRRRHRRPPRAGAEASNEPVPTRPASAAASQQARRRSVARRTLHLLRRAARPVQLQRSVPRFGRSSTLRSRDRRDRDASRTLREARCAPCLSPDGEHLVYATRFRTQTGLRVRNLETGAERWLANPSHRDDQESRASRDTMPGYAFRPGRKRPHRARRRQAPASIDFETGSPRPFRSPPESPPTSRLASTSKAAWTIRTR